MPLQQTETDRMAMAVTMDDEQYQKLLEWSVREARKDFASYIRLCDQSYQMEEMHRRIIHELALVESGATKRLLISTPPRHGKSRLIAKEWPTYILGRHPDKKFIVATHTNALAMDHSDHARARMRLPIYRAIFDSQIRDDASSVKHWKTAQGGEYHTAGITVKLGGFGADIFVLDDMFADFADAHSPTKRDAVFNWYQSTAQTRLSPNGAIVIISTRWHVDDLIGRLLDPMRKARSEMMGVSSDLNWKVLNLPAIAREGDELGRAPGEPLSPKRWPIERLVELQANMEDHVWASLYDGTPTVLGGNYLKTQNFKIRLPQEIPSNQQDMRYWDLAGTNKQTSDFTVGARGFIHGHGDNAEFWICDIVRGKWAWPDAQERIKLQSIVDGSIPLGGEANGMQAALCDILQAAITDVPFQKVFPTVDKVTRAGEWAVKLKQGKVNLVLGDWNSAFIAEAEAFPRGAHDDQIDAISGLWKMLFMGPAAQHVAPKPRDWESPAGFRGRSGRMVV